MKQYPSIISERGTIHTHVYAIALAIFKNCPAELDSVRTWNDFLQKHFLRKKEFDHYSIQSMPQHELHKQLLPYFTGLGLLSEKPPAAKTYNQIVVFGGTPWDTKERFTYLQEILVSGITTQSILYINGERLLHESEQAWMMDQGYGKVLKQHEAAEVIWKKDFSDKVCTQFSVRTITPPKAGVRANTEDTVVDYMQNSHAKSVLFITNGPYGPYQNATVQTVFAKHKATIQADIASSRCRDTISTATLLDTLARWFYTTIHYQTLSAL